MAASLGSSLPAPADATIVVATTAVAAAVIVQDDLEDLVDAVIASALEGINLALSIDNPLGFPAMSPVSREP